MRLFRLSHWTTISTLLFSALTHLPVIQAEQQKDTKALRPRVPLQLSSDHLHREFQSQILTRRFIIIDGYRLALASHVQILPIQIAATELRNFWNRVIPAVVEKWGTNDGSLLVSFGNLQILFESEHPNVALDWVAILTLASALRERVCIGGGWAGFFQGTMTNLATQTVIRVTFQYVASRV